MTPFGWGIVALLVTNSLLTIFIIGRERNPITPGEAAFSVAINMIMMAGVLFTGTGRLN